MLRRQRVQVTGSWAFFRADLSAERISYLVRFDMVTDEGVANISAAVSAAVGGVQAWPLLPELVTDSILLWQIFNKGIVKSFSVLTGAERKTVEKS